jgi:hypothetical protein
MKRVAAFVKNLVSGYEPVLAYYAVRVVFYALATYAGVTVEPELQQELIVAIGGIGIADFLGSLRTRAQVMPMRRVEEQVVEETTLPRSRKG